MKVGVISHVGHGGTKGEAGIATPLPNGHTQQEFTGVGAGSAEHSKIRVICQTWELSGSRMNICSLRVLGVARGASAMSGGCFPVDAQSGLSPTTPAAALPRDSQPEMLMAPSAQGLSQGWTLRPGPRTGPRPKRISSGGGGQPPGSALLL